MPSIFWMSRLFRYGKYVLGSGVCANIFGSLDRYMTASFMTSAFVAFYDVSARINNLMDVPTTAAADILFPKSARASFENDNSRVRFIYEKMVGILVGLVLPISIFTFIFADKIVLIIAGENYLPATTIIRIAMIYAFLRPIQIQASNVLNSINKPKITFYINLIVLSFNIIISYFFIKSIGFMGAAYGSFCTTVFSSCLSFYLLKRAINVSIRGISNEIWIFYKDAISYSRTFYSELKIINFKK
jgi:O-antigen/teichoic acid export membrane protein